MTPPLRSSFQTLIMLLAAAVVGALCASAPLHAQSASDSDGDGLSDAIEQTLGTNPYSSDTDCDGYDDKTEVGDPVNPTDTDKDGLIDARESNLSGYQLDAATRQHLACFRFTPFVIADNDNEAARLEVRVEAPEAVGGVSMLINPLYALVYSLKLDDNRIQYGTELALYDDGTHGDRQAGDRVWTRDGFTAGIQSPALGKLDISEGYFRSVKVTDPLGNVLFSESYEDNTRGAHVWIVSRLALQEPRTPSANVQIVAHVAAIIDPTANRLMTSLPSGWALAAKTVYQFFPDNYDFLVLYQDYDRSIELDSTLAGVYISASNAVTGIGRPLHDITSLYGSEGKLQGVMWIGMGNGGSFGHELMHQWAAPLLPELGLNQCESGSHWGVAGVGKGILGGYDPSALADNGDGTYTVSNFFHTVNEVLRYSQLELYLAGMTPAGQVQSIQVPIDVDCSSLMYDLATEKFTFKASGFQTFTIEQIQQALGGARNPPVEQAQKSFTAGSFVFTDRPLTQAELAFFSVRSQSMSQEDEEGSHRSSFSQLTQGAGAMTTYMLDVTIKGIDGWVATPTMLFTHNAETLDIPVQVGNASAVAGGPISLTLTLDAALGYVSNTLGLPPAVTTAGEITTLRWQWPSLEAKALRQGVVSVSVPATPAGTTYGFTVLVATAGDPLPANNSGSGQILVGEFAYVPLIRTAP